MYTNPANRFDPVKKEIERKYQGDFESFDADNAPENKPCDTCGAIMDRREMMSSGIFYYTCTPCEEKREKERERELNQYEEDKRRAKVIQIIERRSPDIYQDLPPVDFDKKLFDSAFLIFGDFGTGKTYTVHSLAQHMMREQIIKDYVITRAFKMMMDIKASFSTGTYEKVVADYEKLPFLIIDEWGKNSGTDFEEAVLFEIVNTRFEYGRRTGIIVNAKKKEDLLTLIRPDVLDRFRRGIVEINGKSRR